ncbi:MAG: carbamoyl-phosphate synthase large subunit, partial [Deltaproteobacteria bacterium]
MNISRILVANRGEIAVRVFRTAAELEIESVAVYPADDAGSAHVRAADHSIEISGEGPAAYLDAAALIDAARRTGADAIHPGYGFLAEQPEFARACEEAGFAFIGPRPENLELFGDKAAARRHARDCGVPVLAGTEAPASLDEARTFFESLGRGAAVMVKAVAGGGGRGMRIAKTAAELEEALERCASEAKRAFGRADLYVEEFLPDARHIEVQIAGDGRGTVAAIGERDCSVQRRRQKLIEIAPAPGLSASARERIIEFAIELGRRARYRSLGTMEFLVSGDRLAFLEGNARIQVEHPVTEEAFGIDLVALQIAIAEGRSDALDRIPKRPRAAAAEARIYFERIDPDGTVRPAAGAATHLVLPSGPGIRVDTCVEPGYAVNPRYDSLAAKIVARASTQNPAAALRKLARALSETVVEGTSTTSELAAAVVAAPELAEGRVDTGWLDRNLGRLLEAAAARVAGAPPGAGMGGACDARNSAGPSHPTGETAARGTSQGDSGSAAARHGDGLVPVVAPMQATVVSVEVAPDTEVAAGAAVVVLEALK